MYTTISANKFRFNCFLICFVLHPLMIALIIFFFLLWMILKIVKKTVNLLLKYVFLVYYSIHTNPVALNKQKSLKLLTVALKVVFLNHLKILADFSFRIGAFSKIKIHLFFKNFFMFHNPSLIFGPDHFSRFYAYRLQTNKTDKLSIYIYKITRIPN